jgi:CubicO group peptidase (beta-lactamase class C family)
MHDLRLCSKSLVGLLSGIALQQGKVLAPLFSALPEYADLANTDGRDRLTILHLLTMTMGTDRDESSLTYADPRKQRNGHGQRAGSLLLHTGAARRRHARRALDLLR